MGCLWPAKRPKRLVYAPASAGNPRGSTGNKGESGQSELNRQERHCDTHLSRFSTASADSRIEPKSRRAFRRRFVRR
eukprot:scaffold149_cov315-Pinguiococcus_pyrenoidosus.AAC.90